MKSLDSDPLGLISRVLGSSQARGDYSWVPPGAVHGEFSGPGLRKAGATLPVLPLSRFLPQSQPGSSTALREPCTARSLHTLADICLPQPPGPQAALDLLSLPHALTRNSLKAQSWDPCGLRSFAGCISGFCCPEAEVLGATAPHGHAGPPGAGRHRQLWLEVQVSRSAFQDSAFCLRLCRAPSSSSTLFPSPPGCLCAGAGFPSLPEQG